MLQAQATTNAWAQNGSLCEWLFALDLRFDLGCRPSLARGIGEMSPVVGQHGVHLIGHGVDEILSERGSDAPGGLPVQLSIGEL